VPAKRGSSRLGDSLRGYAVHAGVAPNAAQKWKRDGKLVFLRDGSIDRAASDERRRKLTDPTRAGGRGNGNGAGNGAADLMNQARAMREGYDARMAELRYRQLAGELGDIREMEARGYREGQRAKRIVRRLPARLAPILASLAGNPAECMRVLEDEVDRILERISSGEDPDGDD